MFHLTQHNDRSILEFVNVLKFEQKRDFKKSALINFKLNLCIMHSHGLCGSNKLLYKRRSDVPSQL